MKCLYIIHGPNCACCYFCSLLKPLSPKRTQKEKKKQIIFLVFSLTHDGMAVIRPDIILWVIQPDSIYVGYGSLN